MTDPTTPLDLAAIEELERVAKLAAADDNGHPVMCVCHACGEAWANGAMWRSECTPQAVLRLLAAARELAELRGALKFIANDSELFDLWQECDAYHCATPTTVSETGWRSADRALLEYAKSRGWTPGAK